MLLLLLACSSDTPPLTVVEPVHQEIPEKEPTCKELLYRGWGEIIPWKTGDISRLSVMFYYSDSKEAMKSGDGKYNCYRMVVIDPQNGEIITEGTDSEVLKDSESGYFTLVDTDQQLWTRKYKSNSIERYHLATGTRTLSILTSKEEPLGWDHLHRLCQEMIDGTYQLIDTKTLKPYPLTDTEERPKWCISNRSLLQCKNNNWQSRYPNGLLKMGEDLFLFSQVEKGTSRERRLLYIAKTAKDKNRIEIDKPFFNIYTNKSLQYVIADSITCETSVPKNGNWLIHSNDLRRDSPQSLSFIENTGAVRWTIPFPYEVGGKNSSEIFVDYGDFSVIETYKNLLAIDTKDGSIRWQIDHPAQTIQSNSKK